MTTAKAAVELFRATKSTHRFQKNQKVWIALNSANHLQIWFKWRGTGRYVRGTMDKWDSSGDGLHHVIGEIKSIEVDQDFAQRIAESY